MHDKCTLLLLLLLCYAFSFQFLFMFYCTSMQVHVKRDWVFVCVRACVRACVCVCVYEICANVTLLFLK